MARHRHLPNAPIREAVIDIKIFPHANIAGATTELKAHNANDYPQAEDMWTGVLGFEFGATEVKATRPEPQPVGVRFTSADKRCVVAFRNDGFTFSRLPPYETWESMKATAMPLWRQFAEHLGASTVKRVAVRYINVLPLPLPIVDFGDYLSKPPEIPEGLPQALASFFTRILLPDPGANALAAITQAFEGQSENKAPVIFDIDVFKDVDLPASSDDIWTDLDSLRGYKNRIFFAGITEKTAGLFE